MAKFALCAGFLALPQGCDVEEELRLRSKKYVASGMLKETPDAAAFYASESIDGPFRVYAVKINCEVFAFRDTNLEHVEG